ncbi:cytochrome oxidase complex assembly protein 1-domain-containing protein, partial [Ephemerocybe angulata]
MQAYRLQQQILSKTVLRGTARRFYAQTSKPAPPPTLPEPEMFSDTSRPRPYSTRPQRDLPQIKSSWPTVLVSLILAGSGWAIFMKYATNQEKISSSVFRSIMRSLKADPQLHEKLGDAIRPQPEWWLNGDPRILGHISQLQGNIDVSFRIKGSKGAGTIYFTSIRKEKGTPYTV